MSARNHEDDDAISSIDGSSLFSATDSEAVSSPVDGYFSRRTHPHHFYVQDNAFAKKQVPDSQCLESPDLPPWPTEQTGLLNPGPAPPDYYAATNNARMSDGGDAHLAATTPRVLLAAGFSSTRRAPQSMADDAQDLDPESTKARRHNGRRTWRTAACLSMFMTAIVVAAIVLLGTARAHDDTTAPNAPSSTTAPKQPELAYCGGWDDAPSWYYDFNDISNFTIEEAISSPSHELSGRIFIRQAEDDQAQDIRVGIQFETSRLRILDPKPRRTHDSIKVKYPEVDMTTSDGGSCMNVIIWVYVKRGLTLDHWTTKTASFSVSLQDPFNQADGRSGIRDTSTFTTTAGKVESDYWSSRRTIINTKSGSVHGSFALRDLLAITTVSGSVDVDVDPKEADKDIPVPAVFKAMSRAGSVRAEFPIEDELPDRDYETTVELTSGAISGSYIHGTHSSYHTTSGALQATLLPFHADYNSSLFTESIAGATAVRVLSPYAGGALKHMHSQHSTTGAGAMWLRYPSEWEGNFTGKTTAGSLKVHGPGVELDRSNNGRGFPIGRTVLGWKGAGDSFIELATLAGSTDLGIGEL